MKTGPTNKHSNRVLVFVLIVGIVVVWRLWPRTGDSITDHSHEPTAFDQQTPASQTGSISDESAEFSVEERLALANADWKDRVEAAKKLMQNVPLRVTGIVVEENSGNPIPGAKIRFNSQRATGATANKETMSDASARFTVKAADGIALWVSASHPNYVTIPASKASVYPANSGMWRDAAGPTTDRMITLVLRKRLSSHGVMKGKAAKFEFSNAVVCYDLVSGQVSSTSGHSDTEVQLRLDVSPSEPSIRTKFDWNVELQGAAAGFQERTDPAMFEAPEDGYKNSLSFENKAVAEGWSWMIHRDVFVKFENGAFGRFEFRVSATERTGRVYHVYYNLNGARNLMPSR